VTKSVRSYQDLLVWQRGMDLAVLIYEISRNWPKEEAYGLTSQARRAAASVPANIAEGYGRQSTASYSQFLKIARGSLKELETHLILAKRVGLHTDERFTVAMQQSDELGKMLGSLIRSVAKRTG
jgi:four helix bundle protein